MQWKNNFTASEIIFAVSKSLVTYFRIFHSGFLLLFLPLSFRLMEKVTGGNTARSIIHSVR